MSDNPTIHPDAEKFGGPIFISDCYYDFAKASGIDMRPWAKYPKLAADGPIWEIRK